MPLYATPTQQQTPVKCLWEALGRYLHLTTVFLLISQLQDAESCSEFLLLHIQLQCMLTGVGPCHGRRGRTSGSPPALGLMSGTRPCVSAIIDGKAFVVLLFESTLSRAMRLIFPVPDLLEEVRHVDLFRLHLNHPWMFDHSPWSGSSRAFFLKTEAC
jgi:hypothetical protein